MLGGTRGLQNSRAGSTLYSIYSGVWSMCAVWSVQCAGQQYSSGKVALWRRPVSWLLCSTRVWHRSQLLGWFLCSSVQKSAVPYCTKVSCAVVYKSQMCTIVHKKCTKVSCELHYYAAHMCSTGVSCVVNHVQHTSTVKKTAVHYIPVQYTFMSFFLSEK